MLLEKQISIGAFKTKISDPTFLYLILENYSEYFPKFPHHKITGHKLLVVSFLPNFPSFIVCLFILQNIRMGLNYTNFLSHFFSLTSPLCPQG